jgi:hypothetical protein
MAKTLAVACTLCVVFSCAAFAQETGGTPSIVYVKLAKADAKEKGDVFGKAIFSCQEGDKLTVLGVERSFYRIDATVYRISNMDDYIAGKDPVYTAKTIAGASKNGYYIPKSAVMTDVKQMKLQLMQNPKPPGSSQAAGTAMARGFNEDTEKQYIAEGGPEVEKAFKAVDEIEKFTPTGDRRLLKFVKDGHLNMN